VLDSGVTDDPERALELALEIEALGQWALKTTTPGADRSKTARLRYRQALVQRFLRSEFEEKLTPETVPFEYIKSAFWDPSIRKRYIHFDAFRVKDIQYLCCLSIHECNFEPESREPCFAEGKKYAAELFQQVQAKKPKTPEEFDALAAAHMDKVHSGFSLHEFAVFYDINESYEKNTRVDRATESVMEVLLTMKAGDLHAPIRDLFGWHIMYLVNHDPEESKRPEDPEVRKEIGEGIYAGVQERELMKFLGEQLGARKVEIKAGRIKALSAREEKEASAGGE
jgi:hypothetical protein